MVSFAVAAYCQQPVFDEICGTKVDMVLLLRMSIAIESVVVAIDSTQVVVGFHCAFSPCFSFPPIFVSQFCWRENS
jgi:hypothetical protein